VKEKVKKVTRENESERESEKVMSENENESESESETILLCNTRATRACQSNAQLKSNILMLHGGNRFHLLSSSQAQKLFHSSRCLVIIIIYI
jgi:diphthamide synthase subunit DPH2